MAHFSSSKCGNTLHLCHTMPKMGFGTWELRGPQCTSALSSALEIGYRHIDTAHMYMNHKDIRIAIAESGISREELFITTKLWMDEYEGAKAISAVKRAIDELDCEYIDLYLTHWPVTQKKTAAALGLNEIVPHIDTLKTLEALAAQGFIRRIGVSNCGISHLQSLQNDGFTPTANQVECHAFLQQKELHSYCKAHNIDFVAYCPLARNRLAGHSKITKIAKTLGVTEPQVQLAYLLFQGIAVIPKAQSPEHQKENFDAQYIELPQDAIDALSKVDQTMRLAKVPWNEFDV